MNKKNLNNKGFALLLSLIISSIVLSIGLSMLNITLKQLTLGTTTRGSEIAFQTASAGMECLRYTRTAKSADFVAGNPVIADCLVTTASTRSQPDTDVDLYHFDDMDWSISGGSQCIDMDVYIFNASVTGANADVTADARGVSKTCSAGDICTYGFVQGYNRSCAEITSSIFTVQRELTIEF